MVEDVTTSSERLFHVGTTLLCLTETECEKPFFSLDLKDSLRSLNELPMTPDAGPFESFFLVKTGD